MKNYIDKTVVCFGMMFMLASLQEVQAEGLPGGFDDAFGSQFQQGTIPAQPDVKQLPRHALDRAAVVRHWNQIALNATGLDHTPVAQGENRVFGEQIGPGRSSRALAIMHIAVFETVNAIEGQYRSYVGLGPAKVGTSSNVAVSQAAHDTLVSLFPSQAAVFDGLLEEELAEIPDGRMKTNGIALGRRAAAMILNARAADGSQHNEPRVGIEFLVSNDPGKWRQDPLSQIPLALGAYWGDVKPFVLERADQFRAPAPPSLDSAEYAIAYNEVKLLGGDGVTTPTTRTAEQTKIGTYWAYDGTPGLGAPPRLYNQIAMHIAKQMKTDTDVLELARLLALVNVAMADAGFAVWETKYYYQVWRPVTGIRESDEHTGPSGLGDGNTATVGDPAFSPLGAPASNLTGPNFTPPFPAYPSGHAGFGSALFQMLRKFYRTDQIAFKFVSDEYNGVTLDRNGAVRTLVERSFSSLSQAEEENGQSRVYLGIHWAFDKTEGITQGRRVADYVFKNLFRSGQRR